MNTNRPAHFPLLACCSQRSTGRTWLRRSVVSAALLLALACASGCVASAGHPVAIPGESIMDAARSRWLKKIGWTATPEMYEQTYACSVLQRDPLIHVVTDVASVDCAFEMVEQVCTADWEGLAATWPACCVPGEDGKTIAGRVCELATEQFPEIDLATRLFALYAAHDDAVDHGYYYRGTTRDLDRKKLPDGVAEEIAALHVVFADVERELMVERATPPEHGLPLCIGSGHNWAHNCWKRYGIESGRLIHLDSHADMAASEKYEMLGQAHTPDDWAWVVSNMDIDEFIQPAFVDGTLAAEHAYWIVPPWTAKEYDPGLIRVDLCQDRDGVILTYSPDLDYDGFTHEPEQREAFDAAREAQQCGPLVNAKLYVVTGLPEAIATYAKGDVIVLDIDLDYFGTINPLVNEEPDALPAHCLEAAERETMLARFAADLWAIPYPDVISVALSPDFTCGSPRVLLGRVMAILETRYSGQGRTQNVAEVH